MYAIDNVCPARNTKQLYLRKIPYKMKCLRVWLFGHFLPIATTVLIIPLFCVISWDDSWTQTVKIVNNYEWLRFSWFESELWIGLNLENQLYFLTTRHQTHFMALARLHRNMVTNCSLHVIYYRNESLYCSLLVINDQMVNTQMITSTLVQCVKISPSRSREEEASSSWLCNCVTVEGMWFMYGKIRSLKNI